ncbi:TauD/TfdA family dioxygenase [Komagataeibacter rhaeticus]|nr:TauD/TfdA family dioxygenase [Komagataeibacter rhaeticus]
MPVCQFILYYAHRPASQGESDALLQFLYVHCMNPNFQVRFRWQPRSVAFGTIAARSIRLYGITSPDPLRLPGHDCG